MVLAPIVMETFSMNPTRRTLGAPRQALSFAVALALSLLIASCGGAGPESVAGCATDPECGTGAYCLQGTCRASAPPVADFEPPATILASRVTPFVAAVTDPDPGDAVAAHDWAVVRVNAACDPEPAATDGSALEVVFWCAGSFDVTLTVHDRHGVASAPRTRRVEVAPGVGVPTVLAGSPVDVGHRCAGDPLACTLDAPVVLGATAADPTGQALTWRWSALPPDASRAAAVAAFTPSRAAASPTATLETEGTAISGEWRFRARVEDPDGNLAQADVLVRVGNRPPEVDGRPLSLGHRFEAGAYLASGTLVALASDPDGDPVSIATRFAEPAGTGCTTSYAPESGAFGLTCLEPTALIGGVARQLTVAASDVNGASAEVGVPIEIGNRVPVVGPAVPGMTELSLDHTVGPCPDGGSCFLATGTQPFVASDPDGDPVSEVALDFVLPPFPAGSKGEALPGPPAGFRLSTPVSAPLSFRAPDGRGGFAVRGTASDPFGRSAPAELATRIGNRPPVLKTPVPAASAFHSYDAATGQYRATFGLATFEDPDGDPILTTGSAGDSFCRTFAASGNTVTLTCTFGYVPAGAELPPLATFLGAHNVAVRGHDGWDAATAVSDATVTVLNRPPTLTSSTNSFEACDCVCPKFDPTGSFCVGTPTWRVAFSPLLPVQIGATDLDGDPIQVTYSPSTNLTVAQKTALPGSAGTSMIGISFPATYSVTAFDGGGGPAATATVTISGVTCASAGVACQE
jgi:hypothetical protein